MCSKRSGHQVSFHFLRLECAHLVFRQQRFLSLPEVLVVHIKKFQLINWMPTKLGRLFMFRYSSLVADFVD